MLKLINLHSILGITLIITSIFDAFKYSLQASKISKEKSAKTMSRKFINFAILNDIVKLAYGFTIPDWYIIGSSILALFCMIHLWWTIYLYYPYKTYPKEKTIVFKRPPILKYLINSIIPNRIRRHL